MADQANGLLSPWLRSRRIASIHPFLRGRVLDFGCGIGRLAAFVDQDRYIGFDPDEESIGQARTLHPGYVFAERLPHDKEFDSIIALAVFEHLENPGTVLRDLTARLAPGGTLALTTPHASFEWIHTAGAALGLFSHHASDDHETLFDERGLRDLAKSSNLTLTHYRRFLCGANQLAVFSKG